MGWNKLLDEHRKAKAATKEKAKFIISTLRDVEAKMVMMAYQGLKESVLIEEEMKSSLKIRDLTKKHLFSKLHGRTE